ncbi:type I restriction enzyme, S subunit [Acetoanaerobium noterae]|uniref:Type I restriction enzyme, S subunit n=1 Tax=Acetoanaerobium noterae TaxID=745369 RepID=A0A1T5DMM9_9FIRM|nr:hypothetical protein [Acetoanaerobium noterae]SKB72957.1 type I restriction enzyme, S subunit [Acetoanaerobium noterae]
MQVIVNENPSIVWIGSELIEDKITGQYNSVQYIRLEDQLIKNKFIRFEEIIDEYNGGPMGFQLHTSDYVNQGIPVLRTKDLVDLSVELEDPIFISEEKNEELKKSKTYSGDIVISKTGQIGVCSIIPDTIQEANLNQALCNIRINEEKMDKHFLVSFFNCKYGQYQFQREGTGKAVQDGLTKEEIYNIKVPVCNNKVQKYIGNKLREGIALKECAKELRKLGNELLIQVLRLDDLEKEINNQKKKYNWISTTDMKDRFDAEHYKEEFIENIRHINSLEGNECKILKLEDIMDEGNYGILPSSSDYGLGDIKLLRSTDMKNGLINDTETIKVPDKYFIKKARVNSGDVLLEIKGNASSGAISENIEGKMIVNGSIFKFTVKPQYNNYFILAYLDSLSGQLQKKQSLANSIISYLSIDYINNLLIPVIDKNMQDDIGNKFKESNEKFLKSKQLLGEAKKDVEDLIEGNFDMSKLNS